MELPALVRHYVANFRPHAQSELEWFGTQPSLEDAVKFAALAMDRRGKRLQHQRRLAREALQGANTALQASLDKLANCRDFDEIFSTVSTTVRGIPGLGELYVYDTSLRTGAKLGLAPDRVYLHAGTRKGAHALGLDTKLAAIETTSLPVALSPLLPREVEDFLCIYKDRIEQSQ